MASFPLFVWIVLSLFLACLGLFALAVTKTVAPDGQGHARGFLGGCGALLALLFLCGLGVAGLGASLVTVAVGTAVDKNPIRRIEIERGGRHPSPLPSSGESDLGRRSDDEEALRARFTVRGGGGQELLQFLGGLVELDLSELEDVLTVQHRKGADGQAFDVYEFRLPLDERELARFEADVERGLDSLELNLPESVDIEFQGGDRTE